MCKPSLSLFLSFFSPLTRRSIDFFLLRGGGGSTKACTLQIVMHTLWNSARTPGSRRNRRKKQTEEPRKKKKRGKREKKKREQKYRDRDSRTITRRYVGFSARKIFSTLAGSTSFHLLTVRHVILRHVPGKREIPLLFPRRECSRILQSTIDTDRHTCLHEFAHVRLFILYTHAHIYFLLELRSTNWLDQISQTMKVIIRRVAVNFQGDVIKISFRIFWYLEKVIWINGDFEETTEFSIDFL